MATFPEIPGAEAVVAWFGTWPSFHDAEIFSLHIDRDDRPSYLRVRTWVLSEETDLEGRFRRERAATVVFEFRQIDWLRLEGEDADRQNVVSGVTVEASSNGFRIDLGPCYGLAGEIVVKELTVRVESNG